MCGSAKQAGLGLGQHEVISPRGMWHCLPPGGTNFQPRTGEHEDRDSQKQSPHSCSGRGQTAASTKCQQQHRAWLMPQQAPLGRASALMISASASLRPSLPTPCQCSRRLGPGRPGVSAPASCFLRRAFQHPHQIMTTRVNGSPSQAPWSGHSGSTLKTLVIPNWFAKERLSTAGREQHLDGHELGEDEDRQSSCQSA